MQRRYPLPILLVNAARATALLGRARIALLRIGPKDVVELNRLSTAAARREAGRPVELEECDKTAFFISRMATRVPWRADCLVQALAGRRWLEKEGISSRISVGAARGPDGSLEAHAWLLCQDRVVLGGDVTRFNVLLDPDTTPVERTP